MSFNLYHWLFDDAITAGGTGPDGSEIFHYFWPYLIFCGVGLLIWFYFWVEGRKRFVDSTYYLKHMLERYLNWLAIICFIGIPIDLARVVLDGYFFSWRFWRYLWLVALLVWAVLWIVYLVRKFPKERINEAEAKKDQNYQNKSNKGVKAEKVKKVKELEKRKRDDRKKQRSLARRR